MRPPLPSPAGRPRRRSTRGPSRPCAGPRARRGARTLPATSARRWESGSTSQTIRTWAQSAAPSRAGLDQDQRLYRRRAYGGGHSLSQRNSHETRNGDHRRGSIRRNRSLGSGARIRARTEAGREVRLMGEVQRFGVELEQQEGFEFRATFDWPGVAELTLDEPEPLGRRHGPNAARLVAAAVANCLAASLVFCLKSKFRQNPGPVRAVASGRLERNERG